MRYLTFSRQYPVGHPRAGEPTWFVENIMSNRIGDDNSNYFTEHLKRMRDLGYLSVPRLMALEGDKGHTCRDGKHWKAGDQFNPKVWMGKPYASKQLTIGPPITVVKTWNLNVEVNGALFINDFHVPLLVKNVILSDMAYNDGLTIQDFIDWIVTPVVKKQKPFDGQIICWDRKIDYHI